VSKLEADLGNDVEISCHIINEEKKGFHVVWVKKVGTQEVEIGTNKKINKIFEETKRYSAEVNFKVDNDISDVTFVLFIKSKCAVMWYLFFNFFHTLTDLSYFLFCLGFNLFQLVLKENLYVFRCSGLGFG